MADKAIKVLLADDHEVVREGLEALIQSESDMRVVASVGTGRDAVQEAREKRPDVVVMDIRMPDLNGIDATREIAAAPIGAKVLCLSMHREQALISSMLHAGAAGYLIKDCAGRELVDAIRAVAEDKSYISPSIAGDVLRGYVKGRNGAKRSAYSDLTVREREVLQLIAEGVHTKEIAARLGISDKTVAAHRLRIMETLNLRSVAELTRYAIRQGLVEP